jgi:hypothetical protein
MAEPTAAAKRIKEPDATADRAIGLATEAAQRAADRTPDETIPGGKYKVGDVFVDAEGKPLKDQQ